jgi:putative CocE/NonD family hydrolase
MSMYTTHVHYNVRLPMRDGLTLSANLWRPIASQPDERFPAILEMIPYRKDDWRAPSDHQRGEYFAQRGFAFCRLDVRGTGSSDGIALDEYMPEETQDGYVAVEWLAAQSWCNGNVGMWGISYGGFTSIQVAMLQPPHLKAIVPMYATDDRYLDDVHYIGGCVTASELAQYAVSMVGMNALPPKIDYAGDDWTTRWKARLEQTPWLIEWLRQQADGPYWRQGSLAPDYDRITCAIFSIGGWADGYPNAPVRMHAHCGAPRKTLIGNWVHSLPDSAYPGPNVDWLHEVVRFFDHWLKGIDNGVLNGPAFTYFRREYTTPEAFPKTMNGAWIAEAEYPIGRMKAAEFYLGDHTLTPDPSPNVEEGRDWYPHRPAHGTRSSLCYGAGVAPNGLARDLRPDEALSLTYTSEPLTEPLDIVGMPEAVLFLSCTAPVAHVVVRLTDVAPDGTSALVTTGILNLTHRDSHSDPQPLTPGEIYEVHVPLRAIGYRFLPGQRVRLSVASAWWPAIFPSPYPADNTVHRGSTTPSRLILPVVPIDRDAAQPIEFRITPPELIEYGSGTEVEPIWQIEEDVIKDTVTVRVQDGDTTTLPDGTTLLEAEHIVMTAHQHDPAHAQLVNEVTYRLNDHGYDTDIRATGAIRTTATHFHIDIELQVKLNGNLFFQKSWLETIARQLV